MKKNKVRIWSHEPLPKEVQHALETLLRIPDVQVVAAMPDVHLAKSVCVGAVVATEQSLIPDAVGGDIGCGMAAVSLQCSADVLKDPAIAKQVFTMLQREIPISSHRQEAAVLPCSLEKSPLSSLWLESKKKSIARAQFATLGRGNHFVELQCDSENVLWCMIHSGSRGIGQGIREHHAGKGGLCALTADSACGQSYLSDLQWALRYAKKSRLQMMQRVAKGMHSIVPEIHPDWQRYTDCHHNFVRQEVHAGKTMWVHRKGAISAKEGEVGIIPGSMGTCSFHVTGRGESSSLCSSSHGAGRMMSRGVAMRRINEHQLREQMRGIWYQHSNRLRDEAPSAYKDIGNVMRAQKKLTRIVRRLEPLLVYKGV